VKICVSLYFGVDILLIILPNIWLDFEKFEGFPQILRKLRALINKKYSQCVPSKPELGISMLIMIIFLRNLRSILGKVLKLNE